MHALIIEDEPLISTAIEEILRKAVEGARSRGDD